MRWITALLGALICFSIDSDQARSQGYPARPVTIVVAYAAGGATDVIARAVAQQLSANWGRPVIIENKGGANTQIAAAYVTKSAPDGLTLLATADVTFVANPFLYRTLPYDPLKDFAPVSGLGLIDEVLVVNSSSPLHTVTDLIAAARARPGELNYGSFGVGSTPHLSMELLQSKAGVKLTAIQYKGGGPALTDVIAGHIPMTFINVGLMVPAWRAGEVRPIGVGSAERLPEFPDLPTIAETLPGFRAATWFGLFGPAGTPPTIVRKINSDVQDILADGSFHERFLAPNFYRPFYGSPEQLARVIELDAKTWGKIIRDANLVAAD